MRLTPEPATALPAPDFVAYNSDRNDAKASGPAFGKAFMKLAEFLHEATPREECGQSLHLMAHSMGNYVLRHALQGLVDQLQKSQLGFEATQDQLADTLAMYRDKVDSLDERLDTIVHQLRIGFRLRDDE